MMVQEQTKGICIKLRRYVCIYVSICWWEKGKGEIEREFSFRRGLTRERQTVEAYDEDQKLSVDLLLGLKTCTGEFS